jgi:hypothetical protein
MDRRGIVAGLAGLWIFPSRRNTSRLRFGLPEQVLISPSVDSFQKVRGDRNGGLGPEYCCEHHWCIPHCCVSVVEQR